MNERLKIIKDNYDMDHVNWEDLRWLIEQAEILNKIRLEEEELYNDEISLMDFGERVHNLL
ncbi:hypothetical protein M3204_14000 [Mesobacillus subterraneus]|uniref:hypothetical protein n=1 Tax=Mesobacillus subterraneus TaxID=285983 RepID=UPI00203C6CB6|nr:hypothetical protein [Mesobacillus subterraneus]MCM3665526.1 hypothetical protein [Mesobacillus subterraneus]MCM3686085.1 hypothetical protein [Mesobacillus subterraneus]